VTVAVVAFVAGVALVPAAIRIFRRLQTIDVPSERSSHSIPTPRGGGAALVLGVLVAVCTDRSVAIGDLWPYLALMLVFAAVGLLDDLRGGIGIAWRFGVCLLTAAALVPVAIEVDAAATLIVVGIVLVVGFTNSFNFMDGVNGISAVHLVVYGGFLAWLSEEVGFGVGHSIGLALLGAGLAFLPFNAVAPWIFIGDVGTYAFGGIVAFVSVGAIGAGAPAWAVLPVLFPYIADTSLTMLRRLRRGDRWWAPHREHAYQRLVDLGLSHVGVACVVGSISAICGICGAVALNHPDASVALALLAGAVSVLYVAAPPLASRALQAG
jgi:UDP-GlcNAc:undecaprenyl-phosphate/decaprenyl-phosphate GlcNAc-1-phosphate transferase